MVKLISAMLLALVSIGAIADQTAVSKVLDKFHSAAANADGKIYFSLLTENSTFIGTDISETWNKKQFQDFAEPYFSKGKGWTYIPRERHIYFNQNKDMAWFDELLFNEKLGNTRGTGVLVMENGAWKIAQYHFTIPIPNELASGVTEQIKKYENQLESDN